MDKRKKLKNPTMLIQMAITAINTEFKKSKEKKQLIKEYKIKEAELFDKIVKQKCEQYCVKETNIRKIAGWKKIN